MQRTFDARNVSFMSAAALLIVACGSSEMPGRIQGLSLTTTVDDPRVAPWFKVYRPSDLASAVATTGARSP